MDTKALVALRKEAEKAIAEMPDGDLKVKAFEVILGHLLAGGSGAAARPAAHEEDEEEAKPAKKGKAAKSAAARVLVLREEGFFKNQRSMREISGELAAHGWHYPLTALSGTLQGLTQRQEIRRVRVKRQFARDSLRILAFVRRVSSAELVTRLSTRVPHAS